MLGFPLLGEKAIKINYRELPLRAKRKPEWSVDQRMHIYVV